jgi:hypothetical protein
MITVKDEVRKLLDELPDDTTIEDIQYRLYVISKVKRGLEDVAQGRVYDRAEVERRMSRWLGTAMGNRFALPRRGID